MEKCIACGCILTDNNWSASLKRINTHKCRNCFNAWQRANYVKHLDTKRRQGRQSQWRIKLIVLVHYSGTDPPQCANPYGEHKEPYTNIAALTIDHIKDDGAEERKRIFGSKVGTNGFYRWLKKSHYPKGYQVLCWNCQWIKRCKHLKEDFLSDLAYVNPDVKTGIGRSPLFQ